MKVSVFIAQSLDGFIARENGELDWLEQPPSPENVHEDHGFATFFASVDCMVMGRNTFDVVSKMDQWVYGDTPITILSRQKISPPETFKKQVSLYQGDLKALVNQLKQAGKQHMYVDGGQTIQAFLREGLISNLCITTIPVLIGQGIPLFGSLTEDIHLSLIKSQAYSSGLVTQTYKVRTDTIRL